MSFRRSLYDFMTDDFFRERDNYFRGMSNEMNSMFYDLNDTFGALEDAFDEDEMEQEEQPLKKLSHFESSKSRVYTDKDGRKHIFEERIENLPDDKNKYKVVTTKRILPKGQQIEDLKQIPDSKKKKSLKDAKDDDVVEEVSEKVVEGRPPVHHELMNPWYGRSMLEREKGKSKEKKIENKKQEKASGDSKKDTKELDEQKKKQMQQVKDEFQKKFADMEKQFQQMRDQMNTKLEEIMDKPTGKA